MSSKRIPSIKISHIKAFIAAAESESYAQAAAKLGCHQSTISRAIIDLESFSKLPLTGRDFAGGITPVGEEFLPIAKQIVDLLETAIKDLKTENSMQSQPISGRDIQIDTQQPPK